MKKIIVVDDEEKYLNMLKDILENNDYEVETFIDALDAYEYLKYQHCDLVITDLLMKDVSGFQLVQLIRQFNTEVPIIILTGSEDDENELNGLKLQIDDYIRKPFNIDIFLVRVSKAINKEVSDSNTTCLISVNDNVKIDLKRRAVTKDGVEIHLTRREFDLLEMFLKNKNKIISRDDIIKITWNEDLRYIDVRTVDVHVKNIRAKLKIMSIQTIYGVGYRWND